MFNLKDAEQKFQELKEENEKTWQSIVDEIAEKENNQTTRQLIEWQIKLQEKTKVAESFNRAKKTTP